MTPEMERVLMSFSFVFVLKAVFAILAFILFLLLMCTSKTVSVIFIFKGFLVLTSGLLQSRISLASSGSIRR